MFRPLRVTSRFLSVLGCVVVLLPREAAAAQSVFADGRDSYTLLERHLLNRQLADQLEEQPYRLWRSAGRLTFASDLAIGTQQTLHAAQQSRFHGYFLADLFAAAPIVDGLDANLNLLTFNPSASDGYRVSAEVRPGFALHWTQDLGEVDGVPLVANVLGPDLGWVTLGKGLLLEQIPAEGVTGDLSWQGLGVRNTYVGRALWPDDDVISSSLRVFGGLAELGLVNWKTHRYDLYDDREMEATRSAWYLSAAVDLPLGRGFRVAGEYAVRRRQGTRGGALGRIDYLHRGSSWLSVHTGYQLRWYDARFGPRRELVPPSSVFNTPYQEDVYATNSFEYLYLSEWFEQISHTLMLEVHARLGSYLDLFVEAEEWARHATGHGAEYPVLYSPEGFRAPGNLLRLYYRTGVSLLPFTGLPHRLSAFVTNKQVRGGYYATEPISRRFDSGTFWALQLEAWL
ncbi:MAG: hypothetical protein JW940_25780 [Polyangiaceae bacterium]|nr:hypothetical protein [Polyangiaceae bacterium]